MAIYSNPANKAAAFRLYFKDFFLNPDLNNSRGKSLSIYNTAFKLNII